MLVVILSTLDPILQSSSFVTANTASVASAPDVPAKPYSSVPFRRDPDFVDRGDILAQIHNRCDQPAGRVALVGLGGVG